MGIEETGAERQVNEANLSLVVRFNQALNRQDIETMMGLMSEDCVFENTDPPPEGTRYEGQVAVRTFWEQFFRSSQGPMIEIEEIFVAGERCVMRWVYHWADARGEAGHIRGVDIYKIRNDKIAEKLSYVKG